jgi:hypothetical protein
LRTENPRVGRLGAPVRFCPWPPQPGGGYAIFPFGGNFVEAVDGEGQPDWSIEEVDGFGFASAMGLYGDTLVFVSTQSDGDGWGFVGVGPVISPDP